LNTLPRTESGDRVIVREYSYNSLEADVNVTQQDGEWLYYSDCWRRGWRATDNGRPTPLCKADIAYKAIYLSAGKHAVVFRYYDPLSSLLSDIIACVATVAGVVMLLLVLSVGIEKVPNDVTS